MRKPFAMDELIAAVEDALPRRPGASEQELI
jgi:DNA-binding response OmpR family regulator